MQNLQLVQLLGDGMASEVYDGVYEGHPVAVKVFKPFYSQQSIMNEIECLSNLKHKNIVSIIDYDLKNQRLVMERCRNHTLLEILQQNGPLPPYYARHLIRSLIDALQHSLERGYVHRDIKLENVMFSPENEPKLGDFGFATKVLPNTLTTRYMGTPEYMPPELYHNTQIHTDQLPAADIFSLSVVIFSIIIGFLPFSAPKADGDNRRYIFINRNDFSKYWKTFPPSINFDPDFKEMIENTMTGKVEFRYNLQELKNCRWMQGQTATSEEFKSFLNSLGL